MSDTLQIDSSGLFGITRFVDPFVALLVALITLPTLLLSYPVCQWSRRCWVRYVKWKYPNCIVVEDTSTRSILDQGRNQGTYTLLVECSSITTEHLRNHLVHLASTKPLLRMALTTKSYYYAWEKLEDFSVDNHLIISPTMFKGRPIVESNLQDYVSDVTSKYFVPNYPPWQVHVISPQQLSTQTCQQPCNQHQPLVKFQKIQIQAQLEPHHQQSRQFLIRVHHLLLRQEQLALGDFLPLECKRWSTCNCDSPFSNLYAEPSALPRLHQKLTESFSNVWNEFLYNNDPTERPEIFKKRISLWQCAKLAIIVTFSTVKEITKQYRRNKGITFSQFWPLYVRETRKRNFNWSVIFQASVNLLNPAEILRTILAWLWYLVISATLKVPILICREIRAASLLHEHHYYPDSLVSILSCYCPLIFRATLELISIVTIIFSAPFAIMEELFRSSNSTEFRTVSQSGRKVVAWSDGIDDKLLKKIAIVSGAGEADILLAAAVDSLKEYFRCSGQPIPEEILATASFTSQKSLYVNNCESNGLLCLSLPTRTPLFDDDLIEILQVVQKNISEARKKQRAIYAITAAESSSGFLSACLPSVFLKVVLNHLTRRYSIAITHVDGELPVDSARSAVFWKPHQGNCSLSMTLHRHNGCVRLAVMTDAMIGPQHVAITRGFPCSVDNLARILGVSQMPASRSPSPCPLDISDATIADSTAE